MQPPSADVRSAAATQPLGGYVRLYDAQLRSERKSARTIQAYDYALERFRRWFERTEGR